MRRSQQSAVRVETPARNDAFSFWKLPEQWRAALEPTIGPSEAAAERLLLEQYLPGGTIAILPPRCAPTTTSNV